EVDGVLASRDGTIWISEAGMLEALRDGVVTSIRSGKGLPGEQPTSLLEDRAGRLWVGIDSTLQILDGGRFQRVDMPDGRPRGGWSTGRTQSPDGSIWAEIRGKPWKLVRIEDDRVRDVFVEPAVPSARRVAADAEGAIWLGLDSGDLGRLRNGTI